MRTDFGGRRWIRTTEVSDNRFTVCPLWPLGNSPICKAYCLNSRLILELVDGLEPPTCWLQISCSTNWATPAYSLYQQDFVFIFCFSRWLLIYNTIQNSKCQHFFQTFLIFFKKSFCVLKSGLNTGFLKPYLLPNCLAFKKIENFFNFFFKYFKNIWFFKEIWH